LNKDDTLYFEKSTGINNELCDIPHIEVNITQCHKELKKVPPIGVEDN
jgi:hypothetical protein